MSNGMLSYFGALTTAGSGGGGGSGYEFGMLPGSPILQNDTGSTVMSVYYMRWDETNAVPACSMWTGPTSGATKTMPAQLATVNGVFYATFNKANLQFFVGNEELSFYEYIPMSLSPSGMLYNYAFTFPTDFDYTQTISVQAPLA